MAVRTGATILMGFTWHLEGYDDTLYGYVSEPIVPEPSGDRDADAAALTQRIFDVIEEVVRARPALWYMFRPFWPAAAETVEAAEDATSATPVAAPGSHGAASYGAASYGAASDGAVSHGAVSHGARTDDVEGSADG
jgi:hypothetical protein